MPWAAYPPEEGYLAVGDISIFRIKGEIEFDVVFGILNLRGDRISSEINPLDQYKIHSNPPNQTF